jgi:hypothetical protein
MDKESYCVEDVYAAWLAHTRSAYMKYISNHGDSGLKLLDILSEKEMRECLIKYEYKLAEKAAAIEAEKLAKESEISRKEYFPDTYQLLIEDEASINHPLEKLEKNWFCVVQGKDNLAPGGLSRTFFQKSRGRGTHFIIPNGFINPGDMVEVGTSNLYGKITHKKFFVAVMVYDSKILFADCMDEEHMFRYSVYWKSNFKKSTEYEMKYVHGLIMEKVDAIGNLLKTVDADSCKQIIEDIDEKLDILFDEKSRIGKILTGENK